MGYELEMRHIYKSFGTLRANNDVNLHLHKGTIHAIIGENGAGKSTLMSILSGVQKADSGEIILRGEKIEINSPSDAVKYGIGMVYQEFMQFGGLKVLDNIIMGCEPGKLGFINRKAARKQLEDICRTYNFSVDLDAKPDRLPVAVLQQIEIIKVLFKNADILVFDEPTSVLTPQGIEGLFDALRALKERGKTIILITHKLKEVMQISDEITVLKDGEVTGYFSREEAEESLLARLMVGREVMLQADKPETVPGEELLKVTDLVVKDSKGVERVKHASFNVRSGEIVGICGVAGSGESELIAAVTGLGGMEKNSEVWFLGENVSTKGIAYKRRKGMGYVPQDRNRMGVNRQDSILHTAFMGHHVATGAANRFLIDSAEAKSFADRVVRDFNVKTGSVYDQVSSLSGGNVQKLLVGREFSEDYKLMIIEDPTRGIDVGAIEFIWKKILQYAAQGGGVLLVSHELNEVMQLADRILVMHFGILTELENGRSMSEKEIGLYMLGGESDEKTGMA